MSRKTTLILAFLVVVLVGILGSVVYVLATADELVPGATSYHLPMRCEVIYFDITLQPTRTLALACPGVDMIRLWPLPIQHPWFEDLKLPTPPVDSYNG